MHVAFVTLTRKDTFNVSDHNGAISLLQRRPRSKNYQNLLYKYSPIIALGVSREGPTGGFSNRMYSNLPWHWHCCYQWQNRTLGNWIRWKFRSRMMTWRAYSIFCAWHRGTPALSELLCFRASLIALPPRAAWWAVPADPIGCKVTLSAGTLLLDRGQRMKPVQGP